MSTDIVVVGRRTANSAGVVVTTYNSQANERGENVSSYGEATNTDPANISVQVRVNLSDSSHSTKAQEAAQNVAQAVATIIAEATKLPAGTVIPLPGGKSTTAGQLLNDVKATKFIVTDQRTFGVTTRTPNGNGGVGGADRAKMTDTLYFASFAEGTGANSYTNAHWLGQGVNGIILHELGHLSSAGASNYSAENGKFIKEQNEHKTGITDFFSSNYSSDNELFQHGYAMAVGGTLGISLDTYNTLFTSTYDPPSFRGADAVYQANKQENGW